MTTHFFVRQKTIYLRLTLDGKRADISTNKRIGSAIWDKAAEKITGKSDYAKAINTSLNDLLSKVEKLLINLGMNNNRVTLNQIVNELKGVGKSQMTLFTAYEYHIASITKLIGIDYTATTIKRYKSSFASLKRYLKNTDIRLCDLDHKFISEYYTYIKTTDGLQHVNPTRHYLTESEIDTLVNKVFTIDRLIKVRDAFVFQIYTGLSFSDMETFTIDNIEVGVDGKQWIVINRRKTGIRSAVPILPRALAILHKYNNKLPVAI